MKTGEDMKTFRNVYGFKEQSLLMDEIMRPGAKRKPSAILEEMKTYQAPKILRWSLSIFELKRRLFTTYSDRNANEMGLQIDQREQTLLVCRNFNEEEVSVVTLDIHNPDRTDACEPYHLL